MQPADVDMSSLAPYENLPPTTPIKTIVWSMEKYEVAQLCATTRHSDREVAEITKIPLSTIQSWKRHPDFQKYMTDLLLDSADLMKAKSLMVMTKALDARIARAEELDDYGTITGRDTLSIIDQIAKETKDDTGKEESHFMQTITALIEKSKGKALVIQPRNTPKEISTSDD